MYGVGYIDPTTYAVYDGAGDAKSDNCSKVNQDQWTYNAAMLVGASAAMASGSPVGSDAYKLWSDRATKVWANSQHMFFTPYNNATNVLYEQKCEKSFTCNTDELSFKAYLARWAIYASQLLPSLAPSVNSMISASAQAAAQSCSGPNNVCGTAWWITGWDGTKGVGQQMSALEVVQGLLAPLVPFPSLPARSGNGSTTASVVPTSTKAPVIVTTTVVPASTTSPPLDNTSLATTLTVSSPQLTTFVTTTSSSSGSVSSPVVNGMAANVDKSRIVRIGSDGQLFIPV